MTRNTADAEDVRQETLLRAVSRLEQFAGRQDEAQGDLQAWVSRIAANASIDLIRKRRNGKLLSLEDPAGAGQDTLGTNITASEENPEESFARREMRKYLADAIIQLAPELRQVCLLRDVLQYSTQEVAERLGISTVAVRLRLFRAHRRLREKLSHAMQPPRGLRLRTSPPARMARQLPSREPKRCIPLGAITGYACGD